MAKLLTTAQAAKRAGVAQKTIRRWIDEKGLPYQCTAGGHFRIPEDQLTEYLSNLRAQREQRRRDSDAVPPMSVGITDPF